MRNANAKTRKSEVAYLICLSKQSIYFSHKLLTDIVTDCLIWWSFDNYQKKFDSPSPYPENMANFHLSTDNQYTKIYLPGRLCVRVGQVGHGISTPLKFLYRSFIFRSEMSLSSGISRRALQTLENTFFLDKFLKLPCKIESL